MTNRFVLEGIDANTNCVALDLNIEVDATRLATLLDIDVGSFDHLATYPVEPEQLDRLKKELGLTFDAGSLEVWLRAWSPIDALPYKVHTNRELLLMLETRKPFAAFDARPEDDDVEEAFALHVATGKFIRREHTYPDGRRHVFYALPGEAWRIDAYIEMWERADESGWSEELERRQGHLLGYDDWQNDAYIETIYRRAGSSG